MVKYTKKPVTIEAFQLHEVFTEDCESPEWFEKALLEGDAHRNTDGTVSLKTNQGWVTAQIGDYVIQQIDGELYPCKPDIFEATYTLSKNKVTFEDVSKILDNLTYEYARTGPTGVYCTSYIGTFKIATGYSGCVDPANFDEEIGKSNAQVRCLKNSEDKIWELLGFELFKKLNPNL